MSTLTNIQVIEQGGKPVFVVIPYKEYLKLLPPEEVTIPHEVVGLVVKKGMNLILVDDLKQVLDFALK